MAQAGQGDGVDTVSDRLAAEALIVDVDGYEGPLDLLLSMEIGRAHV